MQNYEIATRLPYLGISFFLRPEKGNKQGLKTIIYLKLCVKGAIADISTRIICLRENWDSNKAIGEGEKEINKKLSKVRTDITNIYNSLVQYAPKQITSRRIADIWLGRATIVNPNKEMPIVDILYKMAEDKLQKKQVGVMAHNRMIWNTDKISLFFQSVAREGMTYADLDYNIFNDLIAWLRTTSFKKISKSISEKKNTYLKKYAQLVKLGNDYGLQRGYTKTQMFKYESFVNDATETEFLSAQELQKLENWHFEEFSVLDKVRDMFVFSCYTGFQWCDMVVFSMEFVELYNGEEWIIKPREKTGIKQQIPFFQQAKRIFDKYEGILPLGVEQTHNKQIKFIINSLGITKRITNRCGRKTAGMVWLNSGKVSIDVVSKMLGHKKISTTQEYYAQIQPERIDRETKHLRQTPANEPANHELKSLSELTEPQMPANLSANIPADFSKLVELLADAVAQKIKVA